MLFSEASGRKVVSTATADTVGRVDEFVVDPTTRSVLGLVLKKTDDGKYLNWSAITSFGVDAVTVPGVEAITAGDEKIVMLSDKAHRVLGKRVLTASGDDIGAVEDVDFDAASGAITSLHTKTQRVEGERLVGVGSYAVVVRTSA